MNTASDWQGRVGSAWAAAWPRTERAFAQIAERLDAAIAVHAPPSGRALDIGGGVGSTSIALAAARPNLDVQGADLSADLVAVARERAAGVANLTFTVADAAAHARAIAPLDLIVSRHGVMFFDDPAHAFTALAAAAAPGAPLVFSCFRSRAENPWAHAVDDALGIAPAGAGGYAPGPFGFGDEGFTAAMLAAAGWSRVEAAAHDVAFVVGTGEGDALVEDALGFYRRIGPASSVLAAAEPDARATMEERLRDLLASRIDGGRVAFPAAIRIWTAHKGSKAA